MRMPEVDTDLPYKQGGVLRPISDEYKDGSRIAIYAYVEAESESGCQNIQSHLVEIVKHRKNNGAHEQPNIYINRARCWLFLLGDNRSHP